MPNKMQQISWYDLARLRARNLICCSLSDVTHCYGCSVNKTVNPFGLPWTSPASWRFHISFCSSSWGFSLDISWLLGLAQSCCLPVSRREELPPLQFLGWRTNLSLSLPRSLSLSRFLSRTRNRRKGFSIQDTRDFKQIHQEPKFQRTREFLHTRGAGYRNPRRGPENDDRVERWLLPSQDEHHDDYHSREEQHQSWLHSQTATHTP